VFRMSTCLDIVGVVNGLLVAIGYSTIHIEDFSLYFALFFVVFSHAMCVWPLKSPPSTILFTST